MTENNWKEEEEKIKQAFGDKTWAQIKSEESWRIFKIMSEFVEGIDKLSKIGPCVSIFGSARTSPDSPYYKPVFGEGKRLVLYCASAWRSALATETLQRMGVPGICHLEGGFSAWKNAELPVAEKHSKPHTG